MIDEYDIEPRLDRLDDDVADLKRKTSDQRSLGSKTYMRLDSIERKIDTLTESVQKLQVERRVARRS